MPYLGVTRNLGGFGSSIRWLDALDAGPVAPDLVALQELPHAGARLRRYRTLPEVAAGHEPSNARRSALLISAKLECRPAPVGPLLKLLGAYISAAQVKLGTEWFNVVSVHAAPYEWNRPLPPDARLEPRSCEKHLWHSDVGAAGLIALASTGPVIAVGDYNECLGWDDPRHPGHHCGHEFFTRLDQGGLVDCTTQAWVQERQTGPQKDYQVDRVIADRATASRIRVSTDPLDFDKLSDHAAIWFALDE